jgi:hypothetical protein
MNGERTYFSDGTVITAGRLRPGVSALMANAKSRWLSSAARRMTAVDPAADRLLVIAVEG